jgi:hypothetical protein
VLQKVLKTLSPAQRVFRRIDVDELVEGDRHELRTTHFRAEAGQSAARICEAFLLAGFDAYKKQGSKFLERMLDGWVQSPQTEFFRCPNAISFEIASTTLL